MEIKPLHDRVLLKIEDKKEERTAGGLYIPEQAKEKAFEGMVIAVGDDEEKIKVKPGDRVVYESYSGTDIEIDGEKHLLIAGEKILATIM